MPQTYLPRIYQSHMEQVVVANPYGALWAEMGLGKTVVALHALATLIGAQEVRHCLIVAPKKVAEHTWPSELRKWSSLQWLTWRVLTIQTQLVEKKGHKIRSFKPAKEFLASQDVLAGGDPAAMEHIHIVTRDQFPYFAKRYGRKWPYDMLIIDEACGFKSNSSQRFKAARHVRPSCARVLQLTGTPGAENYLELWSQVYLLDLGERLGRTFTGYKKQYFDSDYMGFKFTLKPGAAKAIHNKLSDICVSLRSDDYLTLPDRQDIVIPTPLDPATMAQYKSMAKDYTAQFDGVDIVADTAAILANKLLQLANGHIYTNVHDTEDKRSIAFHSAKLDALELLLEQADGPLLIGYTYKPDKARILKRFPQARTLDTPGDIDAWNRGEYPAALLHPGSAAGLNLQNGGHLICWYGPPWSNRGYLQLNKRLHRSGQGKPVFVYHLIAPGTYDEKVMAALADKDAGQAGLLDSLKAEIGE